MKTLKEKIDEAIACYKTVEIFRIAVDAHARRLVPEFASEELKRMKRDYELFEELSPPDVPRRDFVKWCFDAWERECERNAQGGK